MRVNVFTLAPADEAGFLTEWKDDAEFVICTAQVRVRNVAARGIHRHRERGLLHRKCWQACGYPAHRDAKPLIRWTLARVMQTRPGRWPLHAPLRLGSHHDATTDARRDRRTRAGRLPRHLPTDCVGKLVDILRKHALTR
ncbi:hypothetical protein [Burkholderia sp. BCC1972]|uniref:hypothetical protein n=1 Tax=Burkholderia sp. BCC1972 TaxID=2817438 RepID=UPI0039F20FB4